MAYNIIPRSVSPKLLSLRGRGEQPGLRQQDEDREVQKKAADAHEGTLHHLRY